MLAVVHSRASIGVSAPEVTVEVHLSGGLPALTIVGLAETGVRESRERVRSALLNAGFEFPARRITINLAPADLPKEGGRFDLPCWLRVERVGACLCPMATPKKQLSQARVMCLRQATSWQFVSTCVAGPGWFRYSGPYRNLQLFPACPTWPMCVARVSREGRWR